MFIPIFGPIFATISLNHDNLRLNEQNMQKSRKINIQNGVQKTITNHAQKSAQTNDNTQKRRSGQAWLFKPEKNRTKK